jgi:hypothetical protein
MASKDQNGNTKEPNNQDISMNVDGVDVDANY